MSHIQLSKRLKSDFRAQHTPRYGAGLKVNTGGVAVGIVRVLDCLAAGHGPCGQQTITAVLCIRPALGYDVPLAHCLACLLKNLIILDRCIKKRKYYTTPIYH